MEWKRFSTNYINPHKNGDSLLVYFHAFETFFFESVGFCRLHTIKKPHSSGIIRFCNVYLTTGAEEFIPFWLLLSLDIAGFHTSVNNNIFFVNMSNSSTGWFEHNIQCL